MKRPKKPSEPQRPEVPPKEVELWHPLAQLRWPDQFGEDGIPFHGSIPVSAFLDRVAADPKTLLADDNVRIRWASTINWDHGEIEIVLERREIVPNAQYDSQIEKFEEGMAEYAVLKQEYDESLKAWEQLNRAYDTYEKTIASKSKK